MCPAGFFHMGHKEFGSLLIRDSTIAVNNTTRNRCGISYCHPTAHPLWREKGAFMEAPQSFYSMYLTTSFNQVHIEFQRK
jgi:hypothetical protein